LSPLSVLPPLLLVPHAVRPRAAGLAFAVGWLLGLGATTGVFLLLPRAIGGTSQEQGAWSAYVRLGIGAALIVAGVVRWLTRGRATRSPAWLGGLSKIRPVGALALGLVLPLVNPKFLFANAAAGLGIATAGLGSFGVTTAVVGYTLLAGSTAVVPILVYAAAPERFDGALARMKDWLERQHAELTAAILVVIGIVLLYQGIRA
jgi:Sap, sulfolipid-1-addressing protein